MRIDLHIHTNASDGALSPEEVVRAAAKGRLDLIAIADHDTVVGVGPAIAEAERVAARIHGAESTDAAAAASGPAQARIPRSIRVLPAIEVSSTLDGHEVHILGYGVDLDSPVLRAHTERARTRREERLEAMVERLGRQGVHLPYEAVLEAAGDVPRKSLGRPHLARALITAGHVETIPEAFDRYIGEEHPAFIPTDLGSPEDAIRTIVQSDGVAVWAHPASEMLDAHLDGFIEAGLRGIEAHRPNQTRAKTDRLAALARAKGLVTSGGSDWHTPETGTALGDFYVGIGEVGGLLERVG